MFCAEDGSGGNPLGVLVGGAAVPEAERQPIAHELGFSETVFVDDAARGAMRIFTPQSELPLAGHPLVGTAWVLRSHGVEVDTLRPPAGEVRVRFDGALTFAAARPEWSPPWELAELGSAAEVDGLTGPPEGMDLVSAWAWIDEGAGLVRARVFAEEAGIVEDEATGSAALMLTARLGRPIEIRQGRGSVIHARPLEDGFAEIGGRVARA